MPSIIEQYVPAFESAVEHFSSELHGLRTGRASSGLVEDIPVEAYGNMMDLKGVASISVPDARTIQIEPWDKTVVQAIEKALIAADLGMQPNTSGSIVRLNIPQMTEENRKHIVKQVYEKAEQARIAIRSIREDARDAIAKAEKKKEIAEDEKFRLQEQLEKKVKEFNDKIEASAEAKEKEIMTI